MVDPDSNPNPARPEAHRAENSIRPSPKRRKVGNPEAPAPKGCGPVTAAAKPTHTVPREYHDGFVVVKNKYYFTTARAPSRIAVRD